MRIYRLIPVALLVVLVAGFAAAPIVTAQDDMMMVACDSDLILNLYIAENYFDYAAISDKMMMAEGEDMMMVDPSTIDKGQYAPLFEEMMAMMDDEMMMSGSVMDEDMMTAVMGAMAMSEEDMMMGMEGDDMMAYLAPLTVADEPEECAALRSELSRFWTSLAYAKLSMSMMDSGS